MIRHDVDDLYIGNGATSVNLAKIFVVEGGEPIGDLSSDEVGMSFGEPVGGKVRMTVGHPHGGG